MKLTTPFTATALVLLSVACGAPTRVSTLSNYSNLVYSTNPITLEKQDQTCLNSFSIDLDINLSIERFIDGGLRLEDINFSDQIQNNELKSSSNGPIRKSIIKHESSKFYSAKYNSQKDSYTYSFKSSNKSSSDTPLEICPRSTLFERQTYEAAGLNISNSITKTYNQVIKFIDPNLLTPIDLHIAPLNKVVIDVKGSGQTKVGYETDNAYYTPSLKRITFLPQSEEHKNFRSSPLWEVPTVASHEYAHHIFRSLLPAQSQASSALAMAHSKSCFGDTAHWQTKTNSGNSRNNTMQFALRSINEGFADLVAHYSLDSDEKSLQGVLCFQNIREVNIDFFSHDIKKVITAKGKKLMDSPTKILSDKNCLTPNFQQVHDVGAIFAYHADRVLNGITSDPSRKLEILLSWVPKLDSLSTDSSKLSSSKYLFQSLEILYLTALETEQIPIDQVGHCAEVTRLFEKPHFSCKYLK